MFAWLESGESVLVWDSYSIWLLGVIVIMSNCLFVSELYKSSDRQSSRLLTCVSTSQMLLFLQQEYSLMMVQTGVTWKAALSLRWSIAQGRMTIQSQVQSDALLWRVRLPSLYLWLIVVVAFGVFVPLSSLDLRYRRQSDWNSCFWATLEGLRSLAPLINFNGVRQEFWRTQSPPHQAGYPNPRTRDGERAQAAGKGATGQVDRADEVWLQKVALLQQALQEEQNR